MAVICFTGFSKSGKDACTQILSKELDYPVFHFSEKLKNDLALLLGIDVSVLYSATKDAEININGSMINLRKAMIDLSWVFKKQDPAFYAKNVADKISKIKNSIISDLRFLVEYETIEFAKPNEITVIRVTNDRVFKNMSEQSEYEHLRIPPDITIDNNGTLEELTEKIKLIAKSFINKE